LSEGVLHPLLQELAAAGTDELPRALIERCIAAIPEIAPELLAAIERAAKVPVAGQAEVNLVCYGVHILAAAREPRLQGPLLRLVRLPDRALDQLLGFDYVETLGPIMIGAFDGDAQALFDLLWDEAVVEFVRPAAFGAVAYLTWLGRIPAETTRACLDRFDTEFQMRDANLGWDGWETAIELLGCEEFAPRVEAAYADGRLDNGWGELALFRNGLAEAAAAAPDDDSRFVTKGYSYIADVLATIEYPAPEYRAYDVKAQDDEPTDEDLVDWDSDDDEPGLTAPASLPSAGRWDEPRRNPLRHVGRNDPCPCGSGKKYKKCCLVG
jgi:hypothetical protein